MASQMNPWLTLQASQGKGLGLFAAQDIPAGTPFLRETPLIPEGVSMQANIAAYRALPPEQQRKYMALFTPSATAQAESAPANPTASTEDQVEAEESKVRSIYKTNGFCDFGVAEIASRFNHACLPNAHWSVHAKELRVYALRDIPAGNEILIDYFDSIVETREMRKAKMKKSWGFECGCPACGDSTAADAEEAWREEIARLTAKLENAEEEWDAVEGQLVVGNPMLKGIIDLCEERLELLREHGYEGTLLLHTLGKLSGYSEEYGLPIAADDYWRERNELRRRLEGVEESDDESD